MIQGVAYEGGGVLGIAYVGAHMALEQHYGLYWDCDLTVAAGTSAGSLFAAAAPAMPTTNKLMQIMQDVPWAEFRENSRGYVRDLWRLWRTGGWNRTEGVKTWVDSYVQQLYPMQGASLTFKQVQDDYGMDLYIDAVDEIRGQHVRFGPSSHPSMKVADAIMASISIQFWFPPFALGDEIYSDGGLVCNHPMDALELAGIKPENSMGFRLVGKPKLRSLDSAPRNPVMRAKNLVKILINHARQSHIPDEYWPRVVKIPTGSYAVTDFDLSWTSQLALREAGFAATERWINDH